MQLLALWMTRMMQRVGIQRMVRLRVRGGSYIERDDGERDSPQQTRKAKTTEITGGCNLEE